MELKISSLALPLAQPTPHPFLSTSLGICTHNPPPSVVIIPGLLLADPAAKPSLTSRDFSALPTPAFRLAPLLIPSAGPSHQQLHQSPRGHSKTLSPKQKACPASPAALPIRLLVARSLKLQSSKASTDLAIIKCGTKSRECCAQPDCPAPLTEARTSCMPVQGLWLYR